MNWIVAPLIVAIIFGTVYKLAELFAHKRERLMLINKLTEIKDTDFKGITLYNSGNKNTALRIGWLLMGVGAGLLLGFLINLMSTEGHYANTFDNSMWDYHHKVAGIVYLSCVCICGGGGLLMSYKAERKAEHPEDRKKEDIF